MPPRPAERERWALTPRARRGRWLAAAVLAVGGGTLIALASAWRGVETMLAGHAIQLATGQTAMGVPGRHMVILYQSTSVHSVFVLTHECSVAYLLSAFLIGSAPLMLLRQLSPWRTATAVAVTAGILILVNMARLTAIGATVSTWGRDPGLAIAHTYLGSLVTVVGTCAAGIAFAAVLVGRRGARRPAVG